MESGIENIAGLVRDLNIAVDAPQDRGQEPFRSTDSNSISLRDTLDVFTRSAIALSSLLQSLASQDEDRNSFMNLPIMEVFSLRKGTKNVEDITLNLRPTDELIMKGIENAVIEHIKSFESQSAPVVYKILSHFDQKIKQIIRDVVFDNASQPDLLWKVVEECYKQINDRSGKLNVDEYFVSLEKAHPHWPSIPDYESIGYCKHEDKQSWTDFWIRVLDNAPAGPTLFYPPPSSSLRYLDWHTVPTYLFRTFDKSSRGKDGESVIASVASIIGSQVDSRTDILTLDMERATSLLFTHLKKPRFPREQPGNLVSWTSSLPFAIQCAVWRRRKSGRSSSDFYICAVDTRNFPQGQFAQDIVLLDAYHDTAKQMGDPIENFFNFRLEKEDFYNGEYLSQGVINHANRSCVVSLKDLKDAGLFKLYPEFEKPGGDNEWTNRVKKLRQQWWVEQATTTDREIQLALQVGTRLFPRFDPREIALLLLSFKNRSFTRRDHTDCFEKPRPGWADKPVEVRRYWMATQAVSSCSDSSIEHHKTIREIFD